MFCYFCFVEKFGAKPGYFFTLLNRCTQILKDLAGWWRSSNNMSGRLFQTREAVWMKLISSWWVFPETTWSRVDVQVLLLWCPSSWTGSYVWPGSWTVKRLLISSRQIFQAAIIFKKWASQYVLHCLLWGPACTGYICCISRALHCIYMYSCWFCCGPYPCRVCWGTCKASSQIHGQVLCRLAVNWLG